MQDKHLQCLFTKSNIAENCFSLLYSACYVFHDFKFLLVRPQETLQLLPLCMLSTCIFGCIDRMHSQDQTNKINIQKITAFQNSLPQEKGSTLDKLPFQRKQNGSMKVKTTPLFPSSTLLLRNGTKGKLFWRREIEERIRNFTLPFLILSF